jgi:hypothetical protein
VPETNPVADGPSLDAAPARGVRSVLLAAGGYGLLAILLWWHVWTSHPTSVTTCGCGDSSLFTWFLAWPAHAMAHGLDPLASTALFHPTGVNLLSNTSVVGIGIPLAPITWLFGPVATLNVALTLSPFLSALAMFVLLRRWVRWAPAAFVGGLLYGFSPFILISLTDGHLMLGMAVIPPLVVLCLDEMLFRQRRSPVLVGLALGVLLTLQYFIGTEILVLLVIASGFGVVLVLLYASWHRGTLRAKSRYAGVALGTAAASAIVLLAYPVWFTLAGPSHLSGSIWGAHTLISYGGANVHDYFLPSTPSAVVTGLAHRFGGYQAPVRSGQYFGLGLVGVLVAGLVIWWRDRRLWLFGALAVVCVLLSFGLGFHKWTLWRLFAWLPQLNSVIPSRFLLITYLAAAVMLGLIVDHTVAGVSRRIQPSPVDGNAPTGTSLPQGRPDEHGRSARAKGWGAAAGVVVSAIALVPIAFYYAPELPFTTQSVAIPQWYRTVAPHLTDDQVLLAFPVPWAFQQSTLTWQAIAGMSYSMVGGGGPGSIPARAGKERAGQAYLGNLSLTQTPGPVTPEQVAVTRHALDGWGVTMVVVPDTSGLPSYDRLGNESYIAAVVTAAVGRAPVRQAGAWLWSGVNHAGPSVQATATELSACASTGHPNTPAAVTRATHCMMQAAAPSGAPAS